MGTWTPALFPTNRVALGTSLNVKETLGHVLISDDQFCQLCTTEIQSDKDKVRDWNR